MRKVSVFAAGILFALVPAAQPVVSDSTKTSLYSPDSSYQLHFHQEQGADGKRAFIYSVQYKGKPVILPSELDIRLDNNLSERAMALKVDKHEKWCENLKLTGTERSTTDNSWTPVYGERSRIKDSYNQVVLSWVKDDNPIYTMKLEFRAYNEGVAFRYFFPENPKGTYYRITKENSFFTFPEGTNAWHHSWAQASYQLLPFNSWPDESERPLLLELPGNIYACIAEARMVDYARTKLMASPDHKNAIVTSMYTPADLISPVATPWRVVMAAETPGQLVENNDLLLNLNDASRIKNSSWIKPGKIIRVMTQTTKDAFENIDFAARHKMQYILFDWKWYGPAFSFSSDATKVAIPDFDLPAIIKYGKKKGIGVWLYCNMQGLYAQSDSLFRVYHKWGIKGVKFGFVQVGSHRWTTWVQEMFRKAAENQIMVNVHDDWRPTGEQRTWPNLMTAEGIRGNEEMPDATHNTILPFTRFIAGAADYTICYYSNRIKTTHAHQLALAAIYYSPIQTLYWYDKPAMSNNEPELEFWDNIPVTWDDSKILQGKPGTHVVTARRSGDKWFLGAITNNDRRTVTVSFDFLEPGRMYNAVLYEDDAKSIQGTKVMISTKKITARDTLTFSLQASGGVAMRIEPVQN